MTLTFLGTGTSQGVPVIGCSCANCLSKDTRDKRLRTAAFIAWNGIHFLIDCGPDFRQQMLQNHIEHIDAVLLTHEHNDHAIGLDDLRPINFMQKRDMPIYSLERTLVALKQKFSYAFEQRPYPGAPKLKLIAVRPNKTFTVEGLQVQPIEVMHGELPILGYRLGPISYITDAKTIEENEVKKLKGTKILVLNALRYKPHYAHFSLGDALELIEKIRPEKAFLTHASHLFPPHEILSKELPENVAFAYDGLIVNL